MLARFAAEHASTSAEAWDYASGFLMENRFIGEGRWAHAVADWFVIGDQWSGHLTGALLDQAKLKDVDAEFGWRHGWWLGGHDGVNRSCRTVPTSPMGLLVGLYPAPREPSSLSLDLEDKSRGALPLLRK
jgi:hypothetical protein